MNNQMGDEDIICSIGRKKQKKWGGDCYYNTITVNRFYKSVIAVALI